MLSIAVELTCKPAGNWVWLDTKEEFLEATRKKIARKRHFDAIAFVTEGELTYKCFNIVKNLYTVELAQRQLTKVDRSTFNSGV